MGFTAIICEFNPLHNGHAELLRYAKENFESPVLCLMSGNFVERGEPAVLPMRERAKCAIEEGADVVLELPVFFSLSYAEGFSLGAVSILKKLRNVDRIVFGTECGDAKLLSDVADVMLNESGELKNRMTLYLNEGLLFAAAREKALCDVYGKAYSDVIRTPNNILGIEYIKAIKKLDANIVPIAIKRLSDGRFASSSEIRNSLGDCENVGKCVPNSTLKALEHAIDLQKAKEKLSDLIKYKAATADVSDLASIAEVTEGLENKIFKELSKASSFDELCDLVKSKRYTMAKIKRILLSFLIGIDKSILNEAIENLSFVRAIAAKKERCELLYSKEFIIAKSERDIPKNDPYFAIEKRADALYSILSVHPLNTCSDGVFIVK